MKWLKKNGASICVAIIASLTAFAGGFYGAGHETELWVKEVRVEEFVRTVNTRMDTIKDMAKALTNAHRAKLLDSRIDKYNQLVEIQVSLCGDATKYQQNEFVCKQVAENNLDFLAVYGEMAKMQSDYLSAILMADILFCEKTKAVEADIQDNVDVWWEISLEQQGTLLRTMKGELLCGLNTTGLLE